MMMPDETPTDPDAVLSRSAAQHRLDDAYRRGQDSLAEVAFDVIDGCDRALAALEDAASAAEWVTGVRLLRDEAMARLSAVGYLPIPDVDHAFDPECHHALSGRGEHVIACARRGWQRDGMVVRVAHVVVGPGRAWEEEPELRRRRKR